MRSYTSLALGLLLVIAGGACGSEDDTASPSGPPPFSGSVPSTVAPTTPSVPDTAQAPNTPAPDAPAAVDPSTPPASSGNESSGNEGNPSDAPLEPSTPPPPAGTETGQEGATPPEDGTQQPAPPDDTQTPPVEEPPAEPAPVGQTRVFLLFGQSNMYGLPAPQAEDLVINPRVEVLTLQACGRHGVDQWMPAQPPLHGCVGQPSGNVFGPGLGPGDYFARAIADAFPDDTILLVPNAIAGVSIDVFQPGQQAYNSMLARARIAQERGEISGFIFHQGESDCGSQQSRQSWPGRVKNVVDRLRSDLGAPNAPFVAGEILYLFGCAGDMNPVIDSLPNTISNTAVVSANGNFGAVQGDNYNNLHFDLAGQRELGKRYGAAMLGLLQP